MTRETAIERIQELIDHSFPRGDSLIALQTALDALKSPILRCRDCIECDDDQGLGVLNCRKIHCYVSPNFFCGYARRRNDDAVQERN